LHRLWRLFLLLANLILASFQKRMGQNVGIKPGEEMLAAIKAAEQLNIPAVMADRPIQTTLRRAWAKTSLWGKSKLLAAMLAQLSMTRAYKVGNKFTVASLSYLTVVFSALAGVMFLGDTVTWQETFGMIIIVASGVLSGIRPVAIKKWFSGH